MPRTLHTKIRLGGGHSTLLNARRVKAVACLGATAGIGLIVLAVQVFK